MILGIGSDLANIERIEATLARFGDRFRNRVFTLHEQRKADGRPRQVAATFAKRWAAKEACSKALGTGLRMGIAWRDMAVTNLRSGQPQMHLTGWAAERRRAPYPDRRSPLGAGIRGDRGTTFGAGKRRLFLTPMRTTRM